MVIYGSTQDLTYYALRRVHTGVIDNIIIKTSGEYLLDGNISEVIKLLMVSNVDTTEVINDIDTNNGKHIKDTMNLVNIMDESFDKVIGGIVSDMMLS